MNIESKRLINATVYEYNLAADDGMWQKLGRVIKHTKKSVWVEENNYVVKYVYESKEPNGFLFRCLERDGIPAIFNFELDPLIQFTLGYTK